MRVIPFKEISSRPTEAELALEPESFRTFYVEALPRVYGYFLRRCGGSVAAAEDLTQETFMAAVAELKKGKRVESPLAWICGIARHKLLDHYRRQERLERPLALAAPRQPAEELVVEDGDDATEHAMAALASVAASQRAALVLCYVDGYSVPEAARLLDKSVEAVESLLARGRQSFRRSYLEELTRR